MKRRVNFRFSAVVSTCASAVMMCVAAVPTSAWAQVPAQAHGQDKPSATVTPVVPPRLLADPTSHGGDDPPQGTGLASDDLGKTTIDLLALQVGGQAAAPGLPIPGDQETASYKRYLETFSKPIPDFFTNTIKSNSGS